MIMSVGGKLNCAVGKINIVLCTGLCGYIHVFNKYYKIYVNVCSVFVKTYKQFVLLRKLKADVQ